MQNCPTLNEVVRQSRERLFPSITNPNWLVLRERRKIFSRWLAQLPSTQLDVLDVGGRLQPYRPLIGNCARTYISVDPWVSPLVNIVALGEQLPLANDHFDLVICTQMLEYPPQPSLVVGEIYRVLKPGGRFLLSVPSAAPVTGEDRWRMLPTGLRSLLAGFQRIEIVPEGSSVAGLFRTVNACLDIFVRYPAARFIYRHSLCPLLNLAGAWLEKLAGSRNEEFTVNYSVLAQK
jgi:SAM-dependent methyltransferase